MASNPYSLAEAKASSLLAQKHPMMAAILVWIMQTEMRHNGRLDPDAPLTPVLHNAARRRGLRELRHGHEREYQQLFRAEKARMGL